MRQTLHIFKKDVRYLRWEIALVLLLVAAFAQFQTSEREDLPNVLIPLAWLYLIGRVIQAEALPGYKQFWITRPYSRSSLFAAKMLFLLVFVTLPIAISDVLIVRGAG